MRLLFIYFYAEKGTFKEKTIIELSKKYSVKRIGNYVEDFKFTLTKRDSFQDNFYGDNIEIGAIIGENGTGKSILINSLRDKKNNYSFSVYEKSNKLFYHGSLDKKLMINNKEVHSLENISYIYYSPIIDMFNTNRNDEYNVSDKQLLLNNDSIPLLNRLAIIENSDISDYFQMNYKDIAKNYLEIKQVELKPLNDFFEQIVEYILQKIRLEDIGKIDLKPSIIVMEFFSEIVNVLSDDVINKYFDSIEKFENLEYILLNNTVLFNNYARVIETKLVKLSLSYGNEPLYDIKEKVTKYFIERLLDIYFNESSMEDRIDNFSIEIEKIYFEYNQDRNQSDVDYKIYKEITNIIKAKVRAKKIDNIKKSNFYILLSCSMYKILSKKHNIEIMIKDMNIREVSDKKEILKFHYSSISYYSKYIDSEIQKKILYKYLRGFRKDLLNTNVMPDLLKYLYILGFESEISELTEYNKLRIYSYLMFSEKIQENIGLKIEDIFHLSDKKSNIIMETVNKSNNLIINIDRENKKIFKEYNKFLLDKKEIPFFSYELNPPLSSGQKAILFIFARIDNAIKQINNKKARDGIVLLLDEADLKLHLEWQRLFINDLIKFLNNNYKNQKFYILYATHSPMILSDITDDRIVFLEKKENKKHSQELPKNRRKRTFGANIYDLYSDSFLVKDSIGAFTSSKINEIIEFFYRVERAKDDELQDLKSEYELKTKEFKYVQKNIGEEFIANIIKNHIEDIEKKLELKMDKEEQIKKLKKELLELGVEIDVKN